jgi:hypothetical protein
MAFTKTPTAWIASWAEDGTNITVPLASFPELTAAEADASSGDIRHIVFAVIEKLYQEWVGRAVADRPTKWTCSKSVSTNTTTGEVTNTYNFVLRTTIASQDVSDEPA